MSLAELRRRLDEVREEAAEEERPGPLLRNNNAENFIVELKNN